MGAGRSHTNLNQCSCEFNNSKRNCKNYKAQPCNRPNKYVLSKIPRMNSNKVCTCNTTLIDCKYSLDALTSEEQLDEVKRVFREKNRGSTADRKKRCANNTSPPICCNCEYTYVGRGGTLPTPNQIERRNGLQKIDRCNGGCQCVMCCENMRHTRMGELSEAEAIAEAIHEYCCKERNRASGNGKSACKCCVCKQPLAVEDRRRRRQVVEEIEEDEYSEDKDADVDEEEVEILEHKRKVEKKKVREEKIQSRMMDDELTEDEEIEDKESAPRRRRKPQESTALNPENGKRSSIDQKYGKGCKCCTCKHPFPAENGRRRWQMVEEVEEVEYDEDKDTDVDEEDLEIVEHKRKVKEEIVIEEKIQCQVLDDELTEDEEIEDKESARRLRRKSQGNAALNPENGKRSSIDQKHAKVTRYTDLDSVSDERINSLEYIELKVQPPSTQPSRRQSQGTTAKTNPCCTCDKGTTTNMVAESTKEQKEPAKAQSTRRIDEEAKARPQRRLSEEARSERPSLRNQTDVKGCKFCRCERKVKENEKLKRDTELNRKPKQRRSLPRRNEEDNKRSRRSIEDEQMPRAREAQPRRDLRDEKWKQQDDMATGTARHEPRRQSTKSEVRTPSQTSSRDRDRKVVESETGNTDRQPAKASDSEADSPAQQRCCCFARKRSQKKRTSVDEKAGSESKEPHRKRRNSEQVARSNKEAECQTECHCKKKKGVPLTKYCNCSNETVQSMALPQDEDTRRQKLAEELAGRLQRRAELQIALQKRLQQQIKNEQNQQRCCCEPLPVCLPEFPCCEPMKQPEPIPISCCEVPPCCCPPTPCCFETSPCCYGPLPCYGQECPCCCQPMPYCYSASCSYPESRLC